MNTKWLSHMATHVWWRWYKIIDVWEIFPFRFWMLKWKLIKLIVKFLSKASLYPMLVVTLCRRIYVRGIMIERGDIQTTKFSRLYSQIKSHMIASWLLNIRFGLYISMLDIPIFSWKLSHFTCHAFEFESGESLSQEAQT